MGCDRWLVPVLACFLLPLCTSMSLRKKWSDEPVKDRTLVDSKGNNGAFFYPDQEYFERDDFDSMSEDSESSDYDDGYYDDNSGWYNLDDEDFELEQQNFIPVLPRGQDFYDKTGGGKGYYKYSIDPDTAINNGYIPVDMEEEYFGNEIDIEDIDKLAALAKRVSDMQDQIRTLQNFMIGEKPEPRDQQYYRRRID